MKKWKKLLAGLLAMAMTLSGTSGYGDEVKAANVSGDFKYEVSEDWDGVIITGYTGNNEEVEIPSDIDGEKVVRIGYRAFSDCSRLKGVTISNSVTSISYGAFLGCSGLENIKVEEGNPKYDSRDGCNAIVERESRALVLGCKNTVIPNSVTSIRKYAFFDCSGLTGITIPTHVISIEYEAFSGCSGLENIKVEEGNLKYDSRDSCNAIVEKESRALVLGCKNTVIPNSVTSIGDGAFSGCSGLTGITIPANMTSIGDGAFSGCSGLMGITIPANVTSIGDKVFSGCSGLENIKVEEGNPKYDSRDGCNAIIETESRALVLGCKNTVIPNNVTSIRGYAFYSCSGLTGITIPASVTSIGGEAFSGCSDLTEITIPDSVTSIGGYAFSGCSGLTEVTIPASVLIIENGVFEDCSGLTEITIPDSVTSIEGYAFSGCSGLTGITIPDGVTSIEGYAFSGCSGLTGITIPASATSIGYGAFSGCSGLKNIKVEEGNPKYDSRNGCNAIVETESGVFVLGCKNTVIPNSVTSIGESAFSGCSGLTGITIPGSVTSIGEMAFSGCSGLTEITIPDSVTNIEMEAFYDCSGLTGITIPGSVVRIGIRAVGWYWSVEERERKEIPGFIIYGVSGSKAERYAEEDGFEFRLVQGDTPPQGGGHAVDISKAVVTLSKTSYTYDGTAKTPSVIVELDGKRLSVDKDYTVSYSSNVKVGTAKVTITGKGGYTGSRTVSFTIDKAADSRPVASIACKKILYKVAYGAKPFKISASSNSRMSFTSSNPKVAVVGKDTGKVTVKGTGVATITIKAGGASKKVTVKVSPKKQAVKSAKAVKGRKLTVKWAKDKRASGYQVQVSVSKDFKKGVKTKVVSKASCTFTKLKPGKRYYVRIRSYKKSGKEKLYGAWSKAKQGGKVKK